MKTDMLNPNPDMLLRIAQADAYAVAVEYLQPEHAPLVEAALQFERYLEHPVLLLGAGRYTDDTQMSIAVAHALIGRTNPTVLDFAEAFVRTFSLDLRGGYSARVGGMLSSSATGFDLLRFGGGNSDFNGAAMRAVPIGVLESPKLIKHVAAKQALPTHDTADAVLSAQAVALMSYYALYTDAPFGDDMLDFLLVHLGEVALDNWRGRWDGRVTTGGPGKPVSMCHITVRAVITLLREETSLMGIMRRLLKWGGDTDTVAAIAWGIASARYQDEVLPEFFERDLEPAGQFGVAFLKRKGEDLMGVSR